MPKPLSPSTSSGRPPAHQNSGLWGADTILVAAFARDDRSEWRLTFQRDRRGGVVLDLRVYEECAGPAKARTPTKHGVSLPVELLDELQDVLTKARVIALENDLVDRRRQRSE